MNGLERCVLLGLIGAIAIALSGCAAEIGSDQWCAEMKAKAVPDWTPNQAMDYAKHCVLK